MSLDSTLERLIAEPRWSFAMAIAWIAWRDLNEVKRYWDVYRRESDAEADSQRLMRPEQRNGAYHWIYLDASIRSRRGNHPLVHVGEAKLSLWAALRTDSLLAEGIEPNTGRRVPIPAREFEELNLYHEKGQDRLRFEIGLFANWRDAYLKPSLLQKDLRRLWVGAADLIVASPAETLAPLRRRGRKKGDGSYARPDQPFIEEMRKLLDGRKVASPEAAAKVVAKYPEVLGASFEAKRDRLAKRFRAKYPDFARNKSI